MHIHLEHVQGMKCTICNSLWTLEALGDAYTCPTCGDKGILDVVYDYQYIKNHWSKAMLDLEEADIFRYWPILPIKERPSGHYLKVGNTPLYESYRFIETFKGQLYIKDDGLNPTGSMKDRASLIAVVKAKELGKEVIACSSTGNAASSLAGNCAKAGLKSVIFVPKRAPEGKLCQLMIYGSRLIIVDGDYKATFTLSDETIKKYGFYNRNAAINPYLVEGKKTVALEIAEQLDFKVPDWVVISVGDGCSIAGVYKGFYDLYQLGFIDSIPKLLGVQASGCKPIYDAFISGNPLEESEEETFADSIAVGIPRNPVKALDAVNKSDGAYIYVSDEEIRMAMKELGRTEGIFVEPASGAAFAGIQKAVKQGVIIGGNVVVINTGNGLKDVVSGLSAVQLPDPIQPKLEIVERILNT